MLVLRLMGLVSALNHLPLLRSHTNLLEVVVLAEQIIAIKLLADGSRPKRHVADR